MDELKPCPFCGWTDVGYIQTICDGWYLVECKNCQCEGALCETIEEAITAWNFRAAEDALNAQLETIKSELEQYRFALQTFRWVRDNIIFKEKEKDE